MADITEHYSHEKTEGHEVEGCRVELFVEGHAIGVDYLLRDLHHFAFWEEGGWGA